jgi:hypothetical protein
MTILTDEQIAALAEKWAAKWRKLSAWNTRRCIDNALREARELLSASKPATPEGWKLVRVNSHFNALIEALEHADDKGYLPDAIRGPWDDFACDENVSVSVREPSSSCDPGDICAGCQCKYNTYAASPAAPAQSAEPVCSTCNGTERVDGMPVCSWKRCPDCAPQPSPTAVVLDDERAAESLNAIAKSVFGGINALRWLLNITTEFDRKDVRTRQAARLLDEFCTGEGTSNRVHLEHLWKMLNDTLSLEDTLECLRAPDRAVAQPVEQTRALTEGMLPNGSWRQPMLDVPSATADLPAFEKWIKDKNPTKLFKSYAWAGWQAARAHPIAEPAALTNESQEGYFNVVQWAVERWHAEVFKRPLDNVHRRSLDDTWRQVIRRWGGDPDVLVGLSHDALTAARPASGETE